jgi:hypothetical protein
MLNSASKLKSSRRFDPTPLYLLTEKYIVDSHVELGSLHTGIAFKITASLSVTSRTLRLGTMPRSVLGPGRVMAF